jgi:phospholipase C
VKTRLVQVALIGAAAAIALISGSPAIRGPVAAADDISKINHVIVIYQENWSFDSLYPHYPGADNLDGKTTAQVGLDGSPLTTAPQPLHDNPKASDPGQPASVVDPAFPGPLPVAPYDLSKYVAASAKTGDIVHRYYQQQVQIDGGKNDKYVAASDNGGLVMSYYDAQNMPEGKLAQQYVMADNFFHSAFGGSFLNHQWLICACTPKWDSAAKPIPEAKRTVLGPNGLPTTTGDGFITVAPDNFLVNTVQPQSKPHTSSTDPAKEAANEAQRVPLLTDPTIGDRLNDKSVTWKWYAGGWDQANAGSPDPNFQFHHQPFNYYKNYAEGTSARKDHLQDEQVFLGDLNNGSLPAVSFIKPVGADNEHPGYATLLQGQQHVANLVRAVQNSSAWKDSLIVITYDENGGRYDHVAPPKGDIWGPGSRVPGIIISPYAKTGYVDHTQYETVSVLRFIEKRYGVQALGTRDAAANDLTNALDFSKNASSTSSVSSSPVAVLVAIAVAAVLLVVAVLVFRRRGPSPS